MNCPHCLTEVAEGSDFCPQCGKAISSPVKKEPETKEKTERTETEAIGSQESTSAASFDTGKSENMQVPADIPQVDPTVAGSAAPSKNKKTGKLIGMGLGVFLLLLLGFGGVWAAMGELPVLGSFPFPALLDKFSMGSSKPIAEIVPAQADVYAEINLDEESDQRKQFATLWNLFPESSKWAEGLQKKLDGTDSDGSEITWSGDIEPWLGDSVGVYYDYIKADPDGEEHEFEFALIVDSSDKKKTNQLIDKSVEEEKKQQEEGGGNTVTEIQYSGITITGFEDDDADTQDEYMAMVGDYLILASSSDELKKCIDTYRGKTDSFASKDGYPALKEKMPSDKLGQMYIDLSSFMDAFSGLLESPRLGSASLGSDFWANYKEAMGFMGMTITAETEGLRLKGYMQMDEDKLKEIDLYEEATSFTPSLASAVPGDAAFYLEGANTKEFIDSFIKGFETTNPGFSAQFLLFKKMFAKAPYNIDIDEDLLSQLDGPYAMGAWAGDSVPSISIVQKLKDPQAMQTFMQKIETALWTFALEQSAPVGQTLTPELMEEALKQMPPLFSEQKYKNVSIWVLNPDLLASIEDYPTDYLRLCYTIVGGYLVISSDVKGAEQFIAVANKETESLAASENYKQLTAGLPSELYSFVYGSREDGVSAVQNIIALSKTEIEKQLQNLDEYQQGRIGTYLEDSISDSLTEIEEQMSSTQDVNVQLEPLKGMVMYSQQEEGMQTLDAFVLIK